MNKISQLSDASAILMSLAIASHQAGQFQEAERHYLAVLQQAPDHPEANHNIGALMVQMKQPLAALPYFLAALEADAASGHYWISYIDALYQAGLLDDARQVLAVAMQQGLQGVDELQQRLNGGVQAPDQNIGTRPTNRQIDELVALFGAGRLDEAAGIAKQLTERYPQHEFGWKALGAVYKQMGNTLDALSPMQKAAALSPNDVEAHYNLGVTLQDLGRFEEAEQTYRHALQINPDYADAHSNLGVTLQNMGRLADAEASYRRAVQLKPDYVAAHCNLGNVLRDQGQLDEAAACYRRVLQISSGLADAHYNLGATLMDMGRLDDAEACFRQALQIKPDYADAHFNLGKILKVQGRLAESLASYRQTVQIKPDMAEAHYNLGNLLLDAGQMAEAKACYQRVIQINPDLADAHYNLGNTLKELGCFAEAEASYRRTIEIKPDHAEAWCSLGNIFLWVGHLLEAEAIFRRAIQIKPDLSEAHCNLGNTLLGLERQEEAQTSYRQALQIKPTFSQAHSNLIFTLDLTADCDAALLREERRRWAIVHAAHLPRQLKYANIKEPMRRLRVGYVSADFRIHSAAYVFGAMLTAFDYRNFEVIAYSNSAVEDELTRTFRNSVSGWRNIARLSDDAASDLIVSDQIDILVDLSGHSAGNRLLVFARKPAPIQISAWGYAAGTGMSAMDVLFSDPVFVPPDEKHLYSEQVRYLPCAIASFLSETCPDVNALPALTGQRITFGSLNRLVKNSEQVYSAWTQILQSIPDSRMVIKAPALDDADTRARVTGYFTRAGIDPLRITLLGKTSREAHLIAFNQIDIALDPFPHGGGVTALEGLMMGVPAVVLRWPTLTGRVSASIMTQLGLTDWIAESREEYVELAIQKARDLQSLAKLRGQLRRIFTSSIIGDQQSYVQAAEREYRQLWKEWCGFSKGNVG